MRREMSVGGKKIGTAWIKNKYPESFLVTG